MSEDIFRPRTEPARGICRAFQEAASRRNITPFDMWETLELKAVWLHSRDWAQMHEG